MDYTHALMLMLVALAGGTFGSMLGLGGGIIIIPLYTLFLDVDPRVAVAASAVAIVTNSVVGSTRHLSNGYVNVRLAMILEITMAIGAIVGALIAVRISPGALKGAFGVIVLYAAWTMRRGRNATVPNADSATPDPLHLRAEYAERHSCVSYVPTRIRFGMSISAGAGVMSGLLGIGGGIVQVPVMNLVLGMPVRAASGTSSFMIGMTGVASALVFYANGSIDPMVVIPAMLGVFAGSNLGSTLTRRLHPQRLLGIFVIVMLYLGTSMILDAFHLNPIG